MVSIIIINYNTFQLTCNCIESIVQYTKDINYEIILVDNNSTECDADLFIQKFPLIKLIKSNSNGGFAKGNNLGIEHANGEFIVLLNSDTYLIEDAISKTANYFIESKFDGILSCKLIYPNGKNQAFARRFKSIRLEILDLFRFVLYFNSYKKRSQIMLGKYFKGDYDTPCDWVGGAFFMFPKFILNNLPNKKLDERFFMYGEDQLWCWQFLQLGYSSFFYAQTKIVHIHKGSSSKQKLGILQKKALQIELELYKIRNWGGSKFHFLVFKFLYSTKEKCRILLHSFLN